jgi:hypothetical protein
VTLIVGIDPSAKKIALVAKETVLNVQHAEAYPLYVRGQTKQTAESIHRAMEAVNDFLDHIEGLIGDAPRHAFIETPVIGRGGATTAMKQAYVERVWSNAVSPFTKSTSPRGRHSSGRTPGSGPRAARPSIRRRTWRGQSRSGGPRSKD